MGDNNKTKGKGTHKKNEERDQHKLGEGIVRHPRGQTPSRLESRELLLSLRMKQE